MKRPLFGQKLTNFQSPILVATKCFRCRISHCAARLMSVCYTLTALGPSASLLLFFHSCHQLYPPPFHPHTHLSHLRVEKISLERPQVTCRLSRGPNSISPLSHSRTLIKMPLQPGNFPRYIRDFSLIYQGKKLFPYIQGNFTLYIR